ncbi:hypothetical protein HDU98_010958, partial [Podochytrium sp. JEL0797]
MLSPLRILRIPSRRSLAIPTRFETTWAKHPTIVSNPFLQTSLQTNFGYTDMTPVQKQVLDAMHLQQTKALVAGGASGVRRDMLVRAKTGTGKTLAFLVAAMQTVFKNPVKKAGVSILVFSPTRELAVQTATEARRLLNLTPHRKGVSHHNVTVVVGGENKRDQIESLLNQPRDSGFRRDRRDGRAPHGKPASSSKYGAVSEVVKEGGIEIVVATPGRMLDLVESVDKVQERLSNVQV